MRSFYHRGRPELAGTEPPLIVIGAVPPGLAELAPLFRQIHTISELTSDRTGIGRSIVVHGPDASARQVRSVVGDPSMILAVVVPGGNEIDISAADEVILETASAQEWRLRLRRLYGVGQNRRRGRLINPKILGLIVHDLRTPLNVIGLSLQTVVSVLNSGIDRSLNEELGYLRSNFAQIDQMLMYVNDYSRSLERVTSVQPTKFSPRKLASELFEDERASKFGLVGSHIPIRIDEACPDEVELNPLRAKQAILYAIVNAFATGRRSGGVVPAVIFGGGDGHWQIEVELKVAPPVGPIVMALDANHFDRMIGVELDRHGLDLAIVAQITREFHGEARLQLEPGKSSTIVIHWPVKVNPSNDAPQRV